MAAGRSTTGYRNSRFQESSKRTTGGAPFLRRKMYVCVFRDSDSCSTSTTDNNIIIATMDIAESQLQILYDIHDNYFTANKKEKKNKLEDLTQSILKTLESISPQENDSLSIARLYYIRGKALDVFSQYSSEAEGYLAKAVKLDPENLDAWIALANSFWKKGELNTAKQCFLNCLEYGQSQRALRDLSMILRQIGKTPEEKSSNILESVIRAKEALKIDIQDGQSWYVLGNAYLALFFCNTHSPSDLDKAFAAYTRAEAASRCSNPDLHYNRANVCRYKEDYAAAVASYEKAHALDPSLPALAAIDAIENWVLRVADLIRRKGRVKVKKLEALVTTLPTNGICIQGRTRTSVSSLKVGRNEGSVVALKLLVNVVRSNEPPGCFVMIDEQYSCIAVSIYHLDSAVSHKLTDKDVFYLLDPILKEIDLTVKGNRNQISNDNPAAPPTLPVDSDKKDGSDVTVRYKCLQVAEPHLFLVNGKVMLESYAHAQVKLDNFDL